MAELVEIDDADDPRLADYRDLRDVELRKHLEAEHGLFLAEGEKVVRRAVEAGFPPRSFLMAPRWLDGLADVLAAHRRALLRRLRGAGRGGHRLPRPPRRAGLAATGGRCPSLDDVLAGARSVLVLEDIVDHTNVGAIFRSRRGARLRRRAARAALRRPALPPVDQGRDGRGVRAAVDPAAGLVRRPARTCPQRGFTTVALTLADDAVPIEEAVAGVDRLALVLGSEGHGLSPRWEQSADRRAIIPMAGGIDSLNVAAATAVACYVAARR